MTGAVAIRPVRADDAGAIEAIYAPYVRDTVITFELVPPDAAEFALRIAANAATHPWLVAERDGGVAGYAYASPYRGRPAYRWVAEVGIYCAMEARGGGIGAALYRALLERLEAQGFVGAIGAMTAPNAASAALHRRLGFRSVGVQPGIGFKQGGWHDVEFWQRDLAPRGPDPREPGVPTRSP